MIYLLLAVLMNVVIFLAFRSYSRYEIKTFPTILVNYAVCVITGLLFVGPSTLVEKSDYAAPWFIASIFLGLCFISTFYLMAKTTQVHGVAVATVASKMSLALPVFFSLFIFKFGTNSLNSWHYGCIILAFFGHCAGNLQKATEV